MWTRGTVDLDTVGHDRLVHGMVDPATMCRSRVDTWNGQSLVWSILPPRVVHMGTHGTVDPDVIDRDRSIVRGHSKIWSVMSDRSNFCSMLEFTLVFCTLTLGVS